MPTVALTLHNFISGLVEKADFTLFPPLYRFIRADEVLPIYFIPKVVKLQKCWRSYTANRKFRGVMDLVLRKLRIQRYHSLVSEFPVFSHLSNTCALLLQNNCNVTDVHFQFLLLEKISYSEKDKCTLDVIRSFSNYLIHSHRGTVAFEKKRWAFRHSKQLVPTASTGCMGQQKDVVSPARSGQLLLSGKHIEDMNAFVDPMDARQGIKSPEKVINKFLALNMNSPSHNSRTVARPSHNINSSPGISPTRTSKEISQEVASTVFRSLSSPSNRLAAAKSSGTLQHGKFNLPSFLVDVESLSVDLSQQILSTLVDSMTFFEIFAYMAELAEDL